LWLAEIRIKPGLGSAGVKILTMLSNFDPICPTHKTEMFAATHWVRVDSKPFPKPVFVCTQANCLYVYDPATDTYSTVPEDAPIGQAIDAVVSRMRLLYGAKPR
jgi:hypothetical protein